MKPISKNTIVKIKLFIISGIIITIVFGSILGFSIFLIDTYGHENRTPTFILNCYEEIGEENITRSEVQDGYFELYSGDKLVCAHGVISSKGLEHTWSLWDGLGVRIIGE